MALSQTKESYLENNGWTACHFIEHVKHFIRRLEYNYDIEYGKGVLHVKKNNKILVKFYVCWKGYDNKHLTVTDYKNKELITYHITDAPVKLGNEIIWYTNKEYIKRCY